MDFDRYNRNPLRSPVHIPIKFPEVFKIPPSPEISQRNLIHSNLYSGPLTLRLNQIYEVEDKVSEGSYGRVYRVKFRDSGTQFTNNIKSNNNDTNYYNTLNKYKNSYVQYRAIKMINLRYDPEIGISSSTVVELALLKRLKHPNIIKIYDIDYDSNAHTLGIVMDLAAGTIFEFLEMWKLRLQHGQYIKEITRGKIEMAYQIICGLNYIHSNGILHLDLKDINILVNEYSSEFEIKLADFGLSELEDGERTNSIQRITWTNRPPEIQCQTMEYGTSADIWSLGMILIEIFFHIQPFIDRDINEIDLYTKGFISLVGLPDKQLLKKFNKSAYCPYFEKIDQTQVNADGSVYFDMEHLIFKSERSNTMLIFKQIYGNNLYYLILDLIQKCLVYEPEYRITTVEAFNHPLFSYFKGPDSLNLLCLKIDPYHFDVDQLKTIEFDPELDQFLYSFNTLRIYSYEIYRRYKLRRKDSNDVERKSKRAKKFDIFQIYPDTFIQAGCTDLAMKLLRFPLINDGDEISNRDILLDLVKIPTIEELNDIEIHIANELSWNLNGHF